FRVSTFYSPPTGQLAGSVAGPARGGIRGCTGFSATRHDDRPRLLLAPPDANKPADDIRRSGELPIPVWAERHSTGVAEFHTDFNRNCLRSAGNRHGDRTAAQSA